MAKSSRKINTISLMSRSTGLLQPVSALWGDYGIGDFGAGARHFVDFLADSGQSLWQVLPLNPLGEGNSPYASASSMAIDPIYIDPQEWVEQGFLDPAEVKASAAKVDTVDYDAVRTRKIRWSRKAFAHAWSQQKFFRSAGYRRFCEEQGDWFGDDALFNVLAEKYATAHWSRWPKPLRDRDPQALSAFRQQHEKEIAHQMFLQFFAHHGWQKIREYAHRKGVAILGDLPIYVAHASVDVWRHPYLFQLNRQGEMTHVAGVPPDAFNRHGQKWGTALYRWEAHQKEGFRYWCTKVKRQLELYDFLRLDHFIGFVRYWSIPAAEKTARNGRWLSGPGPALFKALGKKLGPLPLVAENLGALTPSVEEMRRTAGIPGMGVMQFAFGNDEDSMAHRPHQQQPDTVYYTGTHDNDVLLHWCQEILGNDRHPDRSRLGAVTGRQSREVHWLLIQAAMASPARWTIFPVADVLGLSLSRYRINTPGTPQGNWEVRFPQHLFVASLAKRLREVSAFYDRCPAP